MPRMLRASLTARLSLLTASCVALPTLLACLDHPLKPVQYEAAQEENEGIAITVNKDVDILFVIDNSGSMGEEQLNLSENFGSFVNVLEEEEVEANYRIGITTTDNSNYWCKGAGISDPEAGQFVLSSCQSRLGDFYFSGDDTNAEEACTSFCDQDTIEIQPTTTKGDAEARRRPWLENIEGKTNLPEGVSTVEAMQCFGPQGINGCGFESHLESMWKSLKLANDENQDEFGFLRDNAILSIVFVTDEADCSFNRAFEDIVFGEEGVGNQQFWSLPDVQQSPSSAVCWNAGVNCDGEDCTSANKDVDGNPVSDGDAEDDAVLFPVSKYTSFVESIEATKKDLNPGQEVLVSAIAGVPENYPMIREISYSEGPNANDPESFQARFGIGQGCSSSVAEAVPPVRLREFAETFLVNQDDNNLFSVCSTDYSPALESIAESIRDQLRPACMPACVADNDLILEGVQPLCNLEQTYREDGAEVKEAIPLCSANNEVPEGSDVCFVNLTDQPDANGDFLTATTDDDMQDACIDEGWNLEFRIFRREGVPAPGGAQVSATCGLSQNKTVDCPGLPG